MKTPHVNMAYLIEEVGKWHQDTFETSTMSGILGKLKEEVQELEDAIGTPEWEVELADVALVVFAIAGRYGVDLPGDVSEKVQGQQGTSESREMEMKQYTKTITVQAVQWTGENLAEINSMCVNHGYMKLVVDGDEMWVDDFYYLVKGDFVVSVEPLKNLEFVRQADFLRDYKEVTE